jgi:hypothetical protein
MTLSSLRRNAIATVALLLAACSRVDVALTNAPDTRFAHVWVTVGQLWFHTDTNAAPEDTGWHKVSLSTPVTLDLAALSNGAFSNVGSADNLPAGTYGQLRLVLKATGDSLTSSAADNGLLYNNQVDYTDTDGIEQHQPLDLLAAAKGIGISGEFLLKNNAISAVVASFNTRRDIAQLNYSDHIAFLLRPTAAMTDLSQSGAIAGQVDTSLLDSFISGGAYDVVVNAESLSTDGARHVISQSTSLASDGSFVLAPLPIAAGATTSNYDVVITGRNLRTTLIKEVPVTRAASAAALLETATKIQSSPIPLALGAQFSVNTDPAFAISPRGATVVFYQTVPGGNELPYTILATHVDPLSGTLSNNLALSRELLNVGTYDSGADIAFNSVAAQEGAGVFQVFAEQVDYLRTGATQNISVADAIDQVSYFVIPELSVQSPGSADEIGGAVVRQGNSRSDAGYLFVSRNGDVVTTLALNALSQTTNSPTFLVGNLPGGTRTVPFAAAVYELDARTWASSNTATLNSTTLGASVSLRNGSPGNIQMPVN